MTERPSGTVTFLFTDIEGSTKLWERDRAAMHAALARHDTLLKNIIHKHNGYVFKTVGDAFFAAFASPRQALETALAIQRALRDETWEESDQLRVRSALHTGVADERDDDYFGPTLNRVARLLAAGHGGQVLMSEATYLLVRDDLPSGLEARNLGRWRLRDLSEPEQIYQMVATDLESNFPPLRVPELRPSNLPVQSTSFVGREREIAEVMGFISASRLVTLLGPGGIGKTRIALQVGGELLDRYPDGVWFLELAPLTNPALVPQTVASVLHVKEQPGEPVMNTLLDVLETKRLLILLDNCEHLIDACAQLAEMILSRSQAVHILATSREPLNVPGEVRWQVPALLLPEQPDKLTLDTFKHSDAVRLFVDRARSILPEFRVTDENIPAITEIVSHLDGLPLAIELAAARIQMLSPDQIASRLGDRFRLLKSGRRTAMPRQQTLRAAIDWSYDLLSTAEQIVFNRLSLFAGGFTLDAAERVAALGDIDPLDSLNLLGHLVEKSLVVVDDRDSDRRYRLLETIRAYGLEKLDESSDQEQVRVTYAGYFLDLAEQAGSRLSSDEFRQWLDRCEVELDNIRAVLQWSRSNNLELGLRVASALRPLWWLKGYVREGRQQLQGLLERADESLPVQIRLRALRSLGVLAFRDGDPELARSCLVQVRTIADELGDRKLLATVLRELGGILVEQMSYDEAFTLLQESFDIEEALNDVEGKAWVRIDLGMLSVGRGNYDTARQHLEISHSMAEQKDDQWRVAVTRYFLALVDLAQGDSVAARAHLEASLKICLANNYRWFVPSLLEGFATVAAQERQYDRAVRLAGAAASLWDSIAVVQTPFWRHVIQDWLDETRAKLPASQYDAEWFMGSEMTLDEASNHALGAAESRGDGAERVPLP